MKSPRLWILVFAILLAVYGFQPAGKLLIRTEIQRRTGSRLSMERCNFNLLTGGLLIQGAKVESCSDFDSNDLIHTAPMQIAKIWSKSSLSQLLYRKLSTPTTVMDGVVVGLSPSDERHVPNVEPITPKRPAQQILLTTQGHPFNNELDQLFQNTQQAFRVNQSSYELLDRQVGDLEKLAIQVDNPLRNRETLLATQRGLASLQRELKTTQDTLAKNRENFLQASSTAPQSVGTDSLGSTPLLLGSSTDAASLQNDAKYLAEQLICSTVAQTKPYLGFSSNFARQWLVKMRYSDVMSESSADSLQTVAARGANYRFGSMHEKEVFFRAIHMRGFANTASKNLPFTGQLKNVGSQSLKADESPSFDFAFAMSGEKDATEYPSVTLEATVVPDRQGYRIQCQMIPVGSLIASASDGNWQLAAFGQKSTVNLAWLVHQSEWTLEVSIESSQCEVVVKKNTEMLSSIVNDQSPRFEACYTSEAPVVLARAKFQGDLQNALPEQRSFIYESPILDRLAESMGQQQKVASELSQKQEQQQTELTLKQKLASHQLEIERTYRSLVELDERLANRLRNYEAKIAALLPSRDDVRFSRDNIEGLQR